MQNASFFSSEIRDYCADNPVKSKETLEFLQKFNGRLFEATPSKDHKDHYMTFLEMVESTVESESSQSAKHAKPDKYLPSELNKSPSEKLGRCQICPSWSFTSKTEKKRHMSLLHRNSTGALPLHSSPNQASKHVCNYKGCGRQFLTYHRLYKHRKEQGHQIKKRKVPPSRRENTAKSKAVKTTILAYCQRSEQGNMTDDSDDVSFDGNEEESREECEEMEVEDTLDEDDADEVCTAQPCVIAELISKHSPEDESSENNEDDENANEKINWVQCDTCDQWYHTYCVNLENVTVQDKDFTYNCKDCV